MSAVYWREDSWTDFGIEDRIKQIPQILRGRVTERHFFLSRSWWDIMTQSLSRLRSQLHMSEQLHSCQET